jgi:hypothetical protein
MAQVLYKLAIGSKILHGPDLRQDMDWTPYSKSWRTGLHIIRSGFRQNVMKSIRVEPTTDVMANYRKDTHMLTNEVNEQVKNSNH